MFEKWGISVLQKSIFYSIEISVLFKINMTYG